MANKTREGGREEITLSRTLGLFSVTMIGVGGMIGAGIFALTGIAAGVAGPALVLVFLLNGLVTTLTAMAYVLPEPDQFQRFLHSLRPAAGTCGLKKPSAEHRASLPGG